MERTTTTTKDPYAAYAEALDDCIEISGKRAMRLIAGADDVEMLALDKQYLRSVARYQIARARWVKLRDEQFSEDCR
jgi:hypothetical protein